jgi:hypothetical protein
MWAFVLVLAALVLFGEWLIIDATREDNRDPWSHSFTPHPTEDWCIQMIETDSSGEYISPCGLSRAHHEEVYGE